MIIADLDPADYGYVLSSWRESHHETPGAAHIPWKHYKREYGDAFARLIDDASNIRLGAYDSEVVGRGPLIGWLVATPGKRVDTLHWVYVKHAGDARRNGIMTALLDAADLGRNFVYTLRGRKVDKTTLDVVLADALRKRGITASHIPLKEWLS